MIARHRSRSLTFRHLQPLNNHHSYGKIASGRKPLAYVRPKPSYIGHDAQRHFRAFTGAVSLKRDIICVSLSREPRSKIPSTASRRTFTVQHSKKEMKNITLKIDDDTYRKARLKAAQDGTSVSAMVRDFLTREVSIAEDAEAKRIRALEKLFKEIDQRAQPRTEPLIPLTREEIYAERLR